MAHTSNLNNEFSMYTRSSNVSDKLVQCVPVQSSVVNVLWLTEWLHPMQGSIEEEVAQARTARRQRLCAGGFLGIDLISTANFCRDTRDHHGEVGHYLFSSNRLKLWSIDVGKCNTIFEHFLWFPDQDWLKCARKRLVLNRSLSIGEGQARQAGF